MTYALLLRLYNEDNAAFHRLPAQEKAQFYAELYQKGR